MDEDLCDRLEMLADDLADGLPFAACLVLRAVRELDCRDQELASVRAELGARLADGDRVRATAEAVATAAVEGRLGAQRELQRVYGELEQLREELRVATEALRVRSFG